MARAPRFVRPLTPTEPQELEAGLRSPDALVLRRAPLILASARHERGAELALRVGGCRQAGRDGIQACTTRGRGVWPRGSPRTHPSSRCFDRAGAQALRALLPRPPRDFAKPTGVWTLERAAAGAYAHGVTAWRVSSETLRAPLGRLGVRWRRATHSITRPAPAAARTPARRARLSRLAQQHPDGLLGGEDEVWWSRLARPPLPAWPDDAPPLRLREHTVARADPAPQAWAGYGLLTRPWDGQGQRRAALWRRCVDGRPVRAVPIAVLRWYAPQAQTRGKGAILLSWDNASWHQSQSGRTWLRPHTRRLKQTGEGVRLLAGFLPLKRPWLNPSAPTGLAGKKGGVEPDRLLSAPAVAARVCAAYGCPYAPPSRCAANTDTPQPSHDEHPS